MSYRDAVLADNPISYWRFEETSGTTLVDQQGVQDAINGGGSTDEATLGMSGAFDGSFGVQFFQGQAIEISDNAIHETVGSISIELFVMYGAGNEGQRIFDSSSIEIGVDASNPGHISVILFTQPISGSGGFTFEFMDSDQALDDSQWHHVCFVYNIVDLTASIYIDAVLQSQIETIDGNLSSTSPAHIGNRFPSLRFDGRVDELAIYHSALTQAQISAHYDSILVIENIFVPSIALGLSLGRPREPFTLTPYSEAVLADNPISYWRFEETSGTTLVDEQGVQDAVNGFGFSDESTLGVPGAFIGSLGVRFQEGQEIEIPNNVSLETSGSISVELFVSFGPGSSGERIIDSGDIDISVARSPPGHIFVLLRPESIPGSNGSNFVFIFSDNPIDDDQWHHIVIVYDIVALTGSLYIDSVLQSDVATQVGNMPNTSSMEVGNRFSSSTFNLLVDELAIYHSALTQAQISAHIAAIQAEEIIAVAADPESIEFNTLQLSALTSTNPAFDLIFKREYLAEITFPGLPTIEIPFSSFTARLTNSASSISTLFIPNVADYIDIIDARINGGRLQVYELIDSNILVQRGLISSLALVSFDVTKTSASHNGSLVSVSLIVSQKSSVVKLTDISLRSVINDKQRIRAAFNSSLKPGDTVDIDGDQFIADLVVIDLNQQRQIMEVSEA